MNKFSFDVLRSRPGDNHLATVEKQRLQRFALSQKDKYKDETI